MPKEYGNKHLPHGIKIVYEDRSVIIVNKPSGLLTISTETQRSKTAYSMITDYVRKGYSKSRKRVFIVHRLDRDTSGILIFAKDEKAKLFLQRNWEKNEKKYLAVVHGRPVKKTGTISSYLAENKAYKVYSTPNAKTGKLARTFYKVIKETNYFSLLEITLLTGRKNQIRVHFADMKNPVAGDRKYGKEGDPCKQLALHSWRISFNHPSTFKRLTFEAKVPVYFNKLVEIPVDSRDGIENGTREKISVR